MDIDKVGKMDGYLVLEKVGKKVLRPGGKMMTEKMLELLSISSNDIVVEFAPGVGFTANLALKKNPKSYIGIDSDEEAVKLLSNKFLDENVNFKIGNVAESGLEALSTTKVYGEAMLTMHADHRKAEIIKEAFRVLKPGGFYAIHELALTPDDLAESSKKEMQLELAKIMKVNARPLTLIEWKMLLEENGFEIMTTQTSPMRFLKINRIISDEGLCGFLKIAKNVLTNPEIKNRVFAMRKIFKKYQNHLNAVVILAKKTE